MKRAFLRFAAFLLSAAVLLPLPVGALELGTPFADNAILQRGMPVPIWGWSEPGEKVTVAFAGQRQQATAGKDGKWMVRLDALEASSAPRELTVTVAGKSVTLKNVLVGEVWVASGQSNMQWLANKCDVGRVLQKQIAERVKTGEESAPLIREAKVTDVFATQQPIERATGEWSLEQGDYSAIAFAFAYDLHRELGVPIGILNCSFSQTSIQAWTPREGFAAGEDAYTKAIHQRVLASDPNTPEHRRAWDAFYAGIESTMRSNQQRLAAGKAAVSIDTKTPGNTQGNRDATWLFNARMNPMIPYAVRGAIWNQGYANMNEGLVYYNNLHSLVRGWRARWDRPELPVYFHQFYSNAMKPDTPNHPRIGGPAEMRLGTWLARDIPQSGMASQIDITGGIHYHCKTTPGKRLARHALKNQYGRELVADGPMFRSYAVEGNELTVSFDHAEGGLVVAETGSTSKQIATPTPIDNGADQVHLFHLAGEDRVWHPATLRIDGERVVLSAPGVPRPRGVAYATGGVGFQPNLYNQALLPMTPFIQFDQKMVTRDSWPDDALKIHGHTPDANAVGLKQEWAKMPILSTQFRDNAVLQAGVPITFFGSALHDYGTEAEGEGVIHFRFGDLEKTIPVRDDPDKPSNPNLVTLGWDETRGSSWREWRHTVPAMPATSEPRTLHVSFTIDGELAHERICTNIVVGDVWYVAAPQLKWKLPEAKPGATAAGMVRVMQRKAKRSTHPKASRYSVCVSRTPKNRFASEWLPADDVRVHGMARLLGQRIHAKTSQPVGIIFMQNIAPKDGGNPDFSSWIPLRDLQHAPSLRADYEDLAAVLPGTPQYDANVQRYLGAWKSYWNDYVPEMAASRSVPDGAAWGSMPALAADVSSSAGQTYNVLTHSFTPASLKGIVFLTSPDALKHEQAGEQFSVLAKAWTDRFQAPGRFHAPDSPGFYFTWPGDGLDPERKTPAGAGLQPILIEDWLDADRVLEAILEHAY